MPRELRIGDRERAAAAERLSAHHAAGRLSVDELEHRLERANAAVFAHELDELEADLPRPGDGRWRAPGRANGPAGTAFAPLAIALIALGVAGSIAVGHPLVPLFVLAAFLLWRRAACA
jgi:fatty acid desaturase